MKVDDKIDNAMLKAWRLAAGSGFRFILLDADYKQIADVTEDIKAFAEKYGENDGNNG